MHVVQIIPTLSIGGAERVVVDLVNHAHKDVRHSIILLKNIKPLAGELHERVPLHVLRKKGLIGHHLIGEIEKVLRRIKPHVVHTHLFGADVWGRIAARRLGIPVVTTEHNINKDESIIKHVIKRGLSGYSERYVVPSAAVGDYVHTAYGVRKNHITAIRNGIDITRFSRTKKLLVKQPIRLLILGRLAEQKGHAVALAALSQAAQLPWTLTIAGDGPNRRALNHMVQRLGLSERITFLPATTRPEALYARHDVVLVPSRWEGLGLVAMEGMAAGRLVIGANTGGIPEIITHKKTGLLFDVGSSDSLVREIEYAFDHQKEMEKIAAHAKEKAIESFGIEMMVGAYEKIYRDII